MKFFPSKPTTVKHRAYKLREKFNFGSPVDIGLSLSKRAALYALRVRLPSDILAASCSLQRCPKKCVSKWLRAAATASSRSNKFSLRVLKRFQFLRGIFLFDLRGSRAAREARRSDMFDVKVNLVARAAHPAAATRRRRANELDNPIRAENRCIGDLLPQRANPIPKRRSWK